MSTLIDRLLPDPDAAERHATVIDAPPERVWRVINTFELSDLKAARPLFAARDLVSRLLHGHAQRDLPTAFVPLAEEPGREFVRGVVGQWWTVGRGGDQATIASAADFAAFDRPGYARAVFGFRLEEAGGSRTRLITETRVKATSPDARRRFLRYWVLIRLGSGLIRRLMLRQVRIASEGA